MARTVGTWNHLGIASDRSRFNEADVVARLNVTMPAGGLDAAVQLCRPLFTAFRTVAVEIDPASTPLICSQREDAFALSRTNAAAIPDTHDRICAPQKGIGNQLAFSCNLPIVRMQVTEYGGRLMRSLDDEVLVEYGVFGLMDVDVDRCPRPWPEGSMEPGLAVEAIQNRVDIASAARDHLAAVRLETWPSEPTTDREIDDEVTVDLTSGIVQLWSVTGGPGHEFEIGPASTYHLRVSCQGHDEAAEQDGFVPDHTERYMLQFWPA